MIAAPPARRLLIGKINRAMRRASPRSRQGVGVR